MNLNEVAPPGWGHTKAEKEKTDPSKPKSKIGGSAAAFDRARKEGRFKGSKEDMFKLMWWMKNKGGKPKGKPHYKPGTDKKYKKYQEESKVYEKLKKKIGSKKKHTEPVVPSKNDNGYKPAIEDWVSNHSMGPTEGFIPETMSGKDVKKLAKASALAQSDNPKDQDRARARQVEVDYKDLMKQRKQGKVGVGKSMKEGKSWKSFKTAVKDAVGRKTPKHDYGKDAGAEAAKRLRKKDHEKVNFLDPED